MITFSELLTEATPYNYVEIQAAKKAVAPDIWQFDNGTQNFLVKVNTLVKGKFHSYRKNHDPSIFYIATVADNGTVSKKVARLTKPLNVCATVAAIIAKEMQDNKKNNMNMIRVPTSMGKVEQVSKLVNRYIKLSAPQWEVTGHLDLDGSTNSYIVISRKGSKENIAAHFGISDVNVIPSEVNQMPEEQAEKIADIIDKQIRKTMPTKVSIFDVAGNTEIPPKVLDYRIENPTVHELMRNGKYFGKYDLDAMIFDGRSLSNPDAPGKPIPGAMASNVVNNYDHKLNDNARVQVKAELKTTLEEMNITMGDIIHNRKIPELHAKVKEILKPHINEHHVEEISTEMVDSMIYRIFDNIYAEDIRNDYVMFDGNIQKKHRTVVNSYCGSGYKYMNNFLLTGSGSSDGVKALDAAFEDDGVLVDDKVVVYRSMNFKDYQFLEVANGKLFHFRTFVSTSLNPMLGMSFSGPGISAFTKCESVESIDDSAPMNDSVGTGFIIRGISKIPVLIPGTVSDHVRECEIILPRGTTLKIEHVGIMKSKQYKSIRSALLDSRVLGPDEIAVNEETVYDGDEFMATGRLIEFSDFAHITEAKAKKTSATDKFTNFANAIGRAQSARERNMTPKEKREYEQSRDKFSNYAG